MTKDLGTYFVRVILKDGRGWIKRYETGHRYTMGDGHISPLNSFRISLVFSSEQDLIDVIIYQFTEGNYSCDCNKSSFLSRSLQEEKKAPHCGDTMEIQSLTLIRPDCSEKVIYAKS